MCSRMKEMGFKLYINEEYQGRIITTFLQPNHPGWDFQGYILLKDCKFFTYNIKFLEFYNFLASKNLIIYPGKLTEALSFRIGSIGE